MSDYIRQENHYYSLNDYLRARFGRKVYKLALNGGMTCPNRDGSLDTRGCIFCSEGGSGEFASAPFLSVREQIQAGRRLIERKTDAALYIAYFQAFTNTYGPVDYLRELYQEALDCPEVAVLSIATRPDCLPDPVMELLQEMNTVKPVWVELGLQTIHSRTADYIRRGYSLGVYDQAVKKLRNAGIEVITHVILGLPGESRQDMLETVDYVGHSGVQGIKLQLLHVLRETDLSDAYHRGEFQVLDLEEYIDLLIACLEHLPPDMVIHRLTGDGPKALLEAPLWTGNKKMVLNRIHQEMRKRSVCQGSAFNSDSICSRMTQKGASPKSSRKV